MSRINLAQFITFLVDDKDITLVELEQRIFTEHT